MFGEVIGTIGSAGGPLEVVLLLLDAILHPPEPHIEGFGEFLSHLGIQLLSVSKGGAGGWLFVSHFFEGGDHGGAVSAAGVDTADFGFSGGADDVLERLT
jgi:hypothetical protein